MQSPNVRYRAVIPSSGFRWIYEDDSGKFHLREPPNDWPDGEYVPPYDEIFGDGGEQKDRSEPENGIAPKFLLATSSEEYSKAFYNISDNTDQLRSEPGLYLRFASERATPELIKLFANKFGFLETGSILSVRCSEAPELVEAFAPGDCKSRPDDKYLRLETEKASRWLYAFNVMRQNLRIWTELSSKGDFAVVKEFLDLEFNWADEGLLAYRVEVDIQSKRLQGEIIANSLDNLIKLQWGMAIAAHEMHRQCNECTTWFSVHPGSGRPEKQFCSDACRMRAYRKRKAGEK